MDPETKQMKSGLFKRSMEPHAPNMMYINASSISLIEPVSPDSQMAKLIKQSESQNMDMLRPPAGPMKK